MSERDWLHLAIVAYVLLFLVGHYFVLRRVRWLEHGRYARCDHCDVPIVKCYKDNPKTWTMRCPRCRTYYTCVLKDKP